MERIFSYRQRLPEWIWGGADSALQSNLFLVNTKGLKSASRHITASGCLHRCFAYSELINNFITPEGFTDIAWEKALDSGQPIGRNRLNTDNHLLRLFYPIFNLVSWNMSWEGSRMCLWNTFCLACVVLVSGSQRLIWSSDVLWPCVRAAAWDVDILVFNTLYCWSFVLRHCNGSWYIWVLKALYQVCVCADMVSESQLATWPGVLHNIAILQVLLFMFQNFWTTLLLWFSFGGKTLASIWGAGAGWRGNSFTTFCLPGTAALFNLTQKMLESQHSLWIGVQCVK